MDSRKECVDQQLRNALWHLQNNSITVWASVASTSSEVTFSPQSITCKSTHAETDESTLFVETSGVVAAGVAVAFVDVYLAARTGEAALAVAVVRADGVDASPALLAGGDGRFVALVFIRLAIDSFEALEGEEGEEEEEEEKNL